MAEMEVGSGKRQSNHIIVMEDRIKTAKSIVTRILLESVITALAQTLAEIQSPLPADSA